MNFKISLETELDEPVQIQIELNTHQASIQVQNKTEYEFDVDLQSTNLLYIKRNDLDLYKTSWNYHKNKVHCTNVQIDQFWNLTPSFCTPISECTDQYNTHISVLDDIEWIQDALKYNTTLFFNGALIYNISKPIRTTFL